MRWNHLPVAGGLYAQHPKLIDQFRIIFQAKAEHEEKKAEEDKRKRGQGGRKPSGRSVAGRGRH